MSWQGIGVIVAMAAIVVSFLMAWRGQRQQRMIAEATAARTEAAARLTADYVERVVEALETIAAEGFGPGRHGVLAPARVRWSMRHLSGNNYTLTNTGTATAHAVTLTAHTSLLGPDVVSGGPDLAGGQAITFAAALTQSTRDTTIAVAWDDASQSVERHTWRYPLPPR